MKFLIIGFGSIGKRHFQNLKNIPGIDVIIYRTYKKEKIPPNIEPWIFTDIEEAFAQKPDTVIISNPTHLHMQYALLAAEHKCHIFIEKPLSHNMMNVKKLIKLVKENDLITMMGCNMRFHPSLMFVKNLIDQNVIGNIISARAEVGQYLPDWHTDEDYRKNHSAKQFMGGGVILDLIHELDYVTWLLGDVKEVVAFSNKSSDLDITTEDIAEILLRFKNNSIASVHLDYIQKIPVRICKIIGNDGIIELDLITGLIMLNGVQMCVTSKDFNTSLTYMYEMKHFINCIKNNEQTKNNIENGIKTLKLALAAKKGELCTF